MSNMRQVLSVLISSPVLDFDEVSSSVGNNENYFTFNVNDYFRFGQDGSENILITDSSYNANDILLRHLCGYSNDNDSNKTSKELVNRYRTELLKKIDN